MTTRPAGPPVTTTAACPVRLARSHHLCSACSPRGPRSDPAPVVAKDDPIDHHSLFVSLCPSPVSPSPRLRLTTPPPLPRPSSGPFAATSSRCVDHHRHTMIDQLLGRPSPTVRTSETYLVLFFWIWRLYKGSAVRVQSGRRHNVQRYNLAAVTRNQAWWRRVWSFLVARDSGKSWMTSINHRLSEWQPTQHVQ